ncbi:MAG: endonuclease/exonuclease/phosphatase, partial [Pirellulales bacterium]
MRKALFLILPLAVLAGGWYLAGQPGPEGLAGLGLRVPAASRGVVGEAPASNPAAAPIDRSGVTIRFASFNIQVFGESMLANPAAVQVLVQVIRRF